MKKILAMLMIAALLAAALSAVVYADEASDPALKDTAENVQDNLVTTHHTAMIQGQELAYTAETGTVVLNTKGETCEIFYTAYTLDDVDDPAERPVTFAFNGGPGSCSMFLHVGCLGPRRIDVDEKGYAGSIPVQMADNENSLLDLTDLVIIDAVGTGYSKPVGDSDISAFTGYDNDNRTFGDFIRQYINRHNRWGSEKYLAGESYGTPRAIGVCDYLKNTYSMSLNGLILISSINDFAGIVLSGGNDTPYALNVPTYAADAWYHQAVSQEYLDMELEDYLDEVREFVSTEYVPALFRGTDLTSEEKAEIAEKLAGYIGLSEQDILNKNLRISLEDFCKGLLKDDNLTIGRLDGRIAGPTTSGSFEDGASDPSNAAFTLSYGDAYYNYIISELGFVTDDPYVPLNLDVNYGWTYPIGGEGGYLSQEQTIYKLLSDNDFLKIWVLCGYYDGATPFYEAEWVYNHVFLNAQNQDQISFTYYPSGHMIYMEKTSFDKFRQDAEEWFLKD